MHNFCELVTFVCCFFFMRLATFAGAVGSNDSVTPPPSLLSKCENSTECLYSVTRCVRDDACTAALGTLLLSNSTLLSYTSSDTDTDLFAELVKCIRSADMTMQLLDTQYVSTHVAISDSSEVAPTAAPDFLCGPGCISTFDHIQICAFSACSLRMIQCTNDPVCLEFLIAMQVNPRAAQLAKLDYPLIYLTLSCIDSRCRTNFMGYAETSNTTQCEYSPLDVNVMQATVQSITECNTVSATITTALQHNTSHNLGPMLSSLFVQNMSNASLCDCLYAIDDVDVTMLLGRCIPSGSTTEAPHDIVDFCTDVYAKEYILVDPSENIGTPSDSLCDAACDSCRCTQVGSCSCSKCRERSIAQDYVVSETSTTVFAYDVPGPLSDRTEYVCLQGDTVTDLIGFNFSEDTFRVDASFSELGIVTNETWGSLDTTRVEQLIIIHARITDITDGAFEMLSTLYILELRTNMLTALTQGMFSGLHRLNRMDLASNAISLIHIDTFADLNALQALWLERNQITYLQPGIFDPLVSLMVIRLENNQITMFPAGLLSTSTRLEYFSAQQNHIMRVSTTLFYGFTHLMNIDMTNNVLSACDTDKEHRGTVTAFVCQGCAGNLPVLEDVDAEFQFCKPFAISSDIICADRLQTYREQFINVTYVGGDSITIDAIAPDCTRSTLFERYAFDDADAISLHVMVANLTNSLLPTICAGNDGRMTITGLVRGDFNVTLSARDAAGSVVTLLTWQMHVIDKVVFARTDVPWPLHVLDTVGNTILHDNTKIAVNVTYKVVPPTDVETDLSALSGYFQGDTSNVVFQIYSEMASDRRKTGSALVDSSAGYILCHFTEPGNYTIQLLAINGDMSTVVHVLSGLRDGMWEFEVLHRDVDVAEFGPNGQPCSSNGDAVDDGNEFDQSYTCLCRGQFKGHNCEVAAESAVDRHVLQRGMWISLLFVVLLVLVGLYVLHRYKLHRAQTRFAKPHNFEDELTIVNERGLEVKRDGTGRMRHPVELKRHQIKYIDDEVLGEGEYGVVRKGVYTRGTGSRDGKELPVAVKVLKSNPSDTERTALYREAAITAQFDHANVIGLVGVVTVNEPFLIVLDYCAKGSLKHVLSTSAALPAVETLLGYCESISHGMAYLARLRFVHRDLATRNVLVSANDVVKVADFGLSRDVENSEYYRSADSDARLPIRWTAPEAISGQRFSEKSDVWSYGVTCVEIFSKAETPYRGWLNSYVIEQVLSGYRLRQPAYCPSAVYQSLIRPCFASDASDRPQFSNINAIFEHIDDFHGSNESSSLDGNNREDFGISPEVFRAIDDLGELLDADVVGSIVRRAKRRSVLLSEATCNVSEVNLSPRLYNVHNNEIQSPEAEYMSLEAQMALKMRGMQNKTRPQESMYSPIEKQTGLVLPLDFTFADHDNSSPRSSFAELLDMGGNEKGSESDVRSSLIISASNDANLEEVVYDCPDVMKIGSAARAEHIKQYDRKYSLSTDEESDLSRRPSISTSNRSSRESLIKPLSFDTACIDSVYGKEEDCVPLRRSRKHAPSDVVPELRGTRQKLLEKPTLRRKRAGKAMSTEGSTERHTLCISDSEGDWSENSSVVRSDDALLGTSHLSAPSRDGQVPHSAIFNAPPNECNITSQDLDRNPPVLTHVPSHGFLRDGSKPECDTSRINRMKMAVQQGERHPRRTSSAGARELSSVILELQSADHTTSIV